MDPQTVKDRLSQADEAVVMGNKPASERSILGLTRFRAAAAAVLLTAGMVGVANNVYHDQVATAPQTMTGQVVAKMMMPNAPKLPEGTAGDTWQPASDSAPARHYLIVDVPGTGVEPTVLAVSQATYDRYCAKAEMGHSMGDESTLVGNCGTNYHLDGRQETPIKLDTMEITYTRNGPNGQVEVQQVNGHGKMANGFIERYQLRQQMKQQAAMEIAPQVSPRMG